MSKKRQYLSAEEKVALLKRHLVGREAVSDICDQTGVHPNVFYRWQKEFFENGAAAFQRDSRKSEKAQETKMSRLEAKLQQKDSVLAELMYEHVQLKKSLGEL